MVAIAKPSLVWVNSALREHIRKVWSEKRAAPFFASIGRPPLKGFSQDEELFEFDWQRYAEANPGRTLGGRVFTCLRDAEVIALNLNSLHLTAPGRVVWPLVPRELVTAIHRGQLEIVRLLAMLGWQIHLLVADCGAATSVEGRAVASFIAAVSKCARDRGLRNIETSSLSSYFDISYSKQKDVLDRFRAIATALKVQDLIEINQKDYSKRVLSEIRKSPALDFLRPVLTCAAVLHLANEWQPASGNPKTIVVCGSDERTQWRKALGLAAPRTCLGAVLNPALRTLEGGRTHTVRQRSDWPIWDAPEDLRDTMKDTNAAKWVFVLFGQLPSFPRPDLPANERLGTGKALSAKSWGDEFGIPPEIDGLRLSEFVWHYLDLAGD